MSSKSIRGYRIKSDGKVEKIPGFGLSASKRIQQKKSKKVRPVKRKSP